MTKLQPTATGDADMALKNVTAKLASLISMNTPYAGSFEMRVPGVYINRYSETDTDWVKTFNSPFLFVVAQGAKAVTVGQEAFQVDACNMLAFPVAMPIALKTVQASFAEPFLSIGMELNPERISELVSKMYPLGLPPVLQRSAGYTARADLNIVSALTRLLECLHNSDDAELLAQLAIDEILIRLLRGPIGAHIAEMGFANSKVQRVAKAITWLRDHYSQKIRIPELAELVHMSVSVFHEQFKAVTSMTPLQYQKALRLQEAKRLMVSRQMDAVSASRLVGYVSDSQFSRDYSSYFGSPPRRDITRLRQEG